MCSDIAIRVQNLSKSYQIYEKPHDRLKQFVAPRLQRLLRRPGGRYFSEFRALDDVSFDIEQGQTVGIVGRNGSGKSTLLQLICGTLHPTSGSVHTVGRIAALLELGSGFNPEFTGRENVYWNGAVIGLSREEINARFDDIAAFADIGHFIEQPVKTYSSGMIVRLAFAVAINVEPQILIVDEALSVGDELFQRKCFARIEAIKDTGATILFVSHSATTVVHLCSEALLIDRGELLLMDSAKKVTKQYQRLIFSRPGQYDDVRASIRLGHFGSVEVADEAENGVEATSALEPAAPALFTDDLVPDGMHRYAANGGEIIEWNLEDHSGRKVNIVPSGYLGRVRVKVRFDSTFADTVFGFHIKSVKGIELAGLSHPSFDQGVVSVEAGAIIEVVWDVRLAFFPGTYFFTFGVRSLSAPEFISRVVDAMAIKIIDREHSAAFGLFDMSDVGGSAMRRVEKGDRHE